MTITLTFRKMKNIIAAIFMIIASVNIYAEDLTTCDSKRIMVDHAAKSRDIGNSEATTHEFFTSSRIPVEYANATMRLVYHEGKNVSREKLADTFYKTCKKKLKKK